ncbi:MAG: hypothetical protein WCO35_03830 [Candidatus Nomurabacteria bacterium]
MAQTLEQLLKEAKQDSLDFKNKTDYFYKEGKELLAKLAKATSKEGKKSINQEINKLAKEQNDLLKEFMKNQDQRIKKMLVLTEIKLNNQAN